MKEKIERLISSMKKEENPEIAKTLKAVAVGMTNFHLGIKSATKTAEERYTNHCSKCEYNQEEKVSTMVVIDEKIPQLSKRYCGLCGCVLSYKLRQNIKPCEKWK
ncbi:hypothetical protein JSO60_06675 [Riemerella anatipestifer]|uniref:hypothetical protein n=1 Tax=Riemerella anatipestifer TaxID=34085 RepID=UPI0030C4FF33